MTKRDSVAAGFTTSPMSSNVPRRHLHPLAYAEQDAEDQHSSAGTPYMSHTSSSAWPTSHLHAAPNPSHQSELSSTTHPRPTSSHTAETTHQSPILPAQESTLPDWHPLHHASTTSWRQVHAQYFYEVSHSGQVDNAPPERYLMITEVNRYGIHRNRQPEYFFNGIIGHIRACRNGWIDSWTQANLLSNYWRRHYQIPEVHQHPSSTWWNFEDTHHASLQNVPDMDDTDSIHAQVENSPPVQIHQLATLFWNILNTDRDGNRGILERMEDTDEDLSRHPVQIFGPEDLAHLASHLAATTQTLADQAHAMAAMTDLSDWPQVLRYLTANLNKIFPAFWSASLWLATSVIRAPIRALTGNGKKPRGSEACVWTIWKDVKPLCSAAVCMCCILSPSWFIIFSLPPISFQMQGVQAAHPVLHQRRHWMSAGDIWPDQSDVPANFFSFLKWEEAKPKNLQVDFWSNLLFESVRCTQSDFLPLSSRWNSFLNLAARIPRQGFSL